MTAAEWIAQRRELLDAATGYGWASEDAALMVDARTSLPRALDALGAALALADNPYPDARNISGVDIKRTIEAALRGES